MCEMGNKLGAAVVGLATACIGLGWAAYTNHAWEDYLIALRSAHHWARGDGLVYSTGERLQTFTSPLGVVVPAIVDRAFGGGETRILWIYRFLTLTALGGAFGVFHRHMARHCRYWFTAPCATAMAILDSKTIDCVTGGMETGFLLLFLAITLTAAECEFPDRKWRLGVGFSGLMWARPDSCVYIAAIVASILMRSRRGEKALQSWRTVAWAIALCTVLYSPWIAWTWWYYGTPIPHSVAAKAAAVDWHTGVELGKAALTFPIALVLGRSTVWQTFTPAYVGVEELPPTLTAAAILMVGITSLAWLWPRVRRDIRQLSFLVFVGEFYLSEIVPYASPWYFPPVALLAYLTLGLLFDQILGATEVVWGTAGSAALRVLAVCVLLGQLALFGAAARQAKFQQLLIEDRVRAPIGIWLHRHARSPSDTVLLEPLGYIGYYSQLSMIDYSGIASPRMLQIRKHDRDKWQSLAKVARPNPETELDPAWVAQLKPDWLVVRPAELAGGLRMARTDLLETYELKAVFDESDAVRAVPWLPGRGSLRFYQTYWVLQRRG
jgi:hypothetical protein